MKRSAFRARQRERVVCGGRSHRLPSAASERAEAGPPAVADFHGIEECHAGSDDSMQMPGAEDGSVAVGTAVLATPPPTLSRPTDYARRCVEAVAVAQHSTREEVRIPPPEAQQGQTGWANEAGDRPAASQGAGYESEDADAGAGLATADIYHEALQRPRDGNSKHGHHSPLVCLECGATETPKWQHDQTLCNACGLKHPNIPDEPVDQPTVQAQGMPDAAWNPMMPTGMLPAQPMQSAVQGGWGCYWLWPSMMPTMMPATMPARWQ